MRAVALVIALAGCDYALHIDHVELADAHVDSQAVRADAPFSGICASKVIDDTFMSGGTPCSWGSLFNTNATVMASNGTFTVAPTSASADGGCEAPQLIFADGGVIAHITTVIGGVESWTQIQALGGVNPSIQINNNILFFENWDASQVWSQTPYLGATAMGWIRLRPDRTNNKIIAEYSADAKSWTQFGALPTPPPMFVKPVMEAGVNPGQTYSGIATFARFIVCSS